MQFINYSAIGFDAFCNSSKQDETIRRKKEIIDHVISHYRAAPKKLLFIGFNPAILAMDSKQQITVTQVTTSIMTYLQAHRSDIKYMEWHHMSADHDKFDAVIAMDEFLTFAKTDEEQLANLNKICALSSQLVITTLRDYKNQSFKDREFSIPSVVKGEQTDSLYLEYHDYDVQDRNAWQRSVYEITGTNLRAFAGFDCRQMFFKQCAKFSIDAGASEFLIHKNIMYKSLIKKNYEHVISMRFINGHNQSSRQYS